MVLFFRDRWMVGDGAVQRMPLPLGYQLNPVSLGIVLLQES